MGYSIVVDAAGRYEYEFYMSSHGYMGGTADTLDEAVVCLAIAAADVMEAPFPPSVRQIILADPARFAQDWPSPDRPGWHPMKPYNGTSAVAEPVE